MAQWLVTQGENQFSVEGLGALKSLASEGKLGAGDMVQPPGTNEWMYVAEIDELKDLVSDDGGDDLGDYGRGKGMAMAASGAILVMLVGLIVVGGGAAFYFFQQLPRGDEVLIGEGGLTYSEMLVTSAGVGLMAEPQAGSAVNSPLKKDQSLELMSKRGDFYKARSETGAEGWIGVSDVIPMYQLGGEKVHTKYDPLYNPDRYVEVMNASWMQLPEQAEDNITVFEFMLRNDAFYPMTDLILLATIKDAKGHELEKVEIPIEGIIPSEGRTMVGTLKIEPDKKPKKGEEAAPPRLLTNYTFGIISKDDPDLQLGYSSGVEVKMTAEEFTNASIDILELRAIPDAEAAEVVTQN